MILVLDEGIHVEAQDLPLVGTQRTTEAEGSYQNSGLLPLSWGPYQGSCCWKTILIWMTWADLASQTRSLLLPNSRNARQGCVYDRNPALPHITEAVGSVAVWHAGFPSPTEGPLLRCRSLIQTTWLNTSLSRSPLKTTGCLTRIPAPQVTRLPTYRAAESSKWLIPGG